MMTSMDEILLSNKPSEHYGILQRRTDFEKHIPCHSTTGYKFQVLLVLSLLPVITIRINEYTQENEYTFSD